MATSAPKRKNSPSAFAENATPTTSADLPPSRPRKRPLRKVSPPLFNIGLNNFIYILAFLAALLMAFYSYRIVQYKSEMGGWWNLALGKRPPQMQGPKSSTMSGRKWWGENRDGSGVEDKINALAEALGMPPKELASAIAAAVKEYVPPASLSSVASKETGQNSETMKVLLSNDEEQMMR